MRSIPRPAALLPNSMPVSLVPPLAERPLAVDPPEGRAARFPASSRFPAGPEFRPAAAAPVLSAAVPGSGGCPAGKLSWCEIDSPDFGTDLPACSAAVLASAASTAHAAAARIHRLVFAWRFIAQVSNWALCAEPLSPSIRSAGIARQT